MQRHEVSQYLSRFDAMAFFGRTEVVCDTKVYTIQQFDVSVCNKFITKKPYCKPDGQWIVYVVQCIDYYYLWIVVI